MQRASRHDLSTEEGFEKFRIESAQIDKQVQQKAKTHWDNFKADNSDALICLFHYADEDGEFMSYMEHSGIFDHLSNIRINHH